MRFWPTTMAIVRKDILAEVRSREGISPVLVFTLLVIVIFNFAFSAGQDTMNLVAPGILWGTFAFAGVLSLNRAFIVEREEGCLEGLMACPISREVIYFGKAIGSLLFMLVVEAIALPIFALLYNLPVLSWEIIGITLLATIGFVSVGTLFSAMAVNTKARELVLPLLFLPMVSPVIIAAVKASALALSGEPWGEMTSWIGIIVAFDTVFIVASWLIFNFVVEE